MVVLIRRAALRLIKLLRSTLDSRWKLVAIHAKRILISLDATHRLLLLELFVVFLDL